MVEPDVIVTLPRHIDFPFFRYAIDRYRNYFRQVLIGLTDHGMKKDYSTFLINNTRASFKKIKRAEGHEDWRNKAVNYMLEKSYSDYVLFLEPDFLIRDERFFEVLFSNREYNFIYYKEDNRIHPACAFIRRDLIDKTRKDFSAKLSTFDHFGIFFDEILRNGCNHCTLEDIGLLKGVDYLHLGGLTQNYYTQPYYNKKEFLTYNRLCMRLPVVFNEFKDKMIAINQKNLDEISSAVVCDMFPKAEKEEKG